MDYTKYYEARDIMGEIITKDLLGPVAEDEIICDERPLDYYILGKLYPQGSGYNDQVRSSSEDCGEIDDEIGVSLSNSGNLSSFGLSFAINANVNSFTISSQAAQYVLISEAEAREKLGFEEGKYKQSALFWKRTAIDLRDVEIVVDVLKKGVVFKKEIADHLSLRVLLHKEYADGSKTISVSMVNEWQSDKAYATDAIHSFFQPEIKIYSNQENAFCDVRRNKHLNKNDEIAELELLYSKIGDYASGHGCAVNWSVDNEGSVTEVFTVFLPQYEVLQMMPSTSFQHDILQMHYVATANQNDVLNGLGLLCDAYEHWIGLKENELLSLSDEYLDAAKANMEKCKKTLLNLRESIKCLSDKDAFEAFSLANEAMFMQRKQMLINSGKFSSDEDIKWYPFQLAFFIQEIVSFVYPESEYRKTVDLLWFPTGGGKTEAYLGIAAFSIFFRRIKHGDAGKGVTVLMRYTLRLLSFQQFERASALVCACELLRRKHNIRGGEIGIGLWAGKALTPNKIDMANRILHGEKDDDSESSNPVQLRKCPWCGKELSEEDYQCDLSKKRMFIRCHNAKCEFHSGLPVYLIDEEIYEHAPAFIVATIDKFAQIALNYETSALFGRNKNLLPPDLIIQDELHLISGPLGTITGLYEAGIKKLCENNGIYPKIVASTATIRNAKEQIKALYSSSYSQFPPQGIDITDSFFAVQSTRELKPARLYLGCMGIGTSPTTMMIRAMASLLFASRYLSEQGYEDSIIDPFWTITGYFNTLRELGGAIIRVVDDIQDRFDYLRTAKFSQRYPLLSSKKRYDAYKELTSREKSENIGNVIQKELKEEYRSDGSTSPYDFLLSSNMISVGVDVGRLGTMVVVGQPKTTSEYIQATSRVGRETPGLVLTTYNQAKSRDRSHYEDFTQYHQTFYRFVEATSVTPFSDRARDRALQALYVILCRNLIPQLASDTSAKNFNRSIPGLKEIRDYILNYVAIVDPSERDHVQEDIEEIEKAWEDKAARRDKLRYKKTKYVSANDVLFDPDYDENSRFRVLNTMRSVETTVKVSTTE